MSDSAGAFDIPEDKKKAVEKARKDELWSLFFLFTIIVVLGFTMGASQAMKAMWLEDLISLIPSTAVLVGIDLRGRAPTERFPYGYRRGVQIGFLAGAVALVGLGAYLLISSGYSLIIQHHPTIQSVEVFGTRVWLGWLMIAALAYSIVPPFVLGLIKRPVAEELHDKAIYASATIDKGDWLSGVAAIAGIVGIGLGYWWADSAAAALISLEILKDGGRNLINSVGQLMNMHPTDVANKTKDPINDRLDDFISGLKWVRSYHVRLREDGDVIAGEALVVPREPVVDLHELQDATDRARELDWRLQDFNIVPVASLDGTPPELKSTAAGAR
jgi:divalent metal cation (Fe/Co/Zn/Cd) transporter